MHMSLSGKIDLYSEQASVNPARVSSEPSSDRASVKSLAPRKSTQIPVSQLPPPTSVPQPSLHFLHSPYYACPGFSYLAHLPRPVAILFFMRVCAAIHLAAAQPAAFLPSVLTPVLSEQVAGYVTMSVPDVTYPLVLIPPVMHKSKIGKNKIAGKQEESEESLFFPGVALPPLSLLPHAPSLAYLLLSLVKAMLLGPHGHVLAEVSASCRLAIDVFFIQISYLNTRLIAFVQACVFAYTSLYSSLY